MTRKVSPNPDLAVGKTHKQRWNSPPHRRHGFHNAHQLFRRSMMFRSRNVLQLVPNEDPEFAAHASVTALTGTEAFSALVCLRADQILLARAALDFSVTQPHSIQSITKMHIHLIVGLLQKQGLLDLGQTVDHYLPDIGSGYRGAVLQDLLDMNIANNFTEDYANPQADCYREEIALGWRLPPEGQPDLSLREFAFSITGGDLTNRSGHADYKSANTDVLTLICAQVSPRPMASLIEDITDLAGYEGSFTISASCDRLPAFSGGGCLSAMDLARFGLLFTKEGCSPGNHPFLQTTVSRQAPSMSPPKDWLRYSNHVMTDDRFIGHAGYGGQFLMVDQKTGLSCAYLSVLTNESGYDDSYMEQVIRHLRDICQMHET
ncbi:class A beta-lactamase-related serine hydrolase (plasmid) [Parasedimentitalea marina]|uniref:Class A beta-lactamase-related serine hydrolase n=1 Tax=Parasedimentitalea marina TaxID=2483033 RepID=A0A3T0N9R9_9RHOB|nr:serine hydrolase domain-containing protein [Parasedimentitalea marina]AZV80715.1 class A beta-lactamase-related serine hydrolase [Parasedimentitalea marina]